MPTLLNSDDKAKIKRNISQATNKIVTAGIARLYVTFPNDSRWRDTGLTGAAVLAYDEVGKCFFFKLVDVIGNQGILWDQELYEGFQYHQDRTFFHSFEIPGCIAGFSFSDEHEARNFHSKVDSRQKKISGGMGGIGRMGSKMKGLFGKTDKQDISAPRTDSMVQTAHVGAMQQNGTKTSNIDPNDPEWAGLLDQLALMGITEDQIAGNEEFIKSFVSSKQAEEPEAPRRDATRQSSSSFASPRSQAPPPPPPPTSVAITPTTSTTTTSAPPIRRLPPPVSANTPPMRSLPPPAPPSATASYEASPRDSLDSARKAAPPTPPASRSKNKPPPPPSRGSRHVSTPEPPYAPAVPGKIPTDEGDRSPRLFGVPPPFEGIRKTASLSRKVPAAPSVPARNGPPVPSRSNGPPVPSRGSGPPVPTRGGDQPRSVPPLPPMSHAPPPAGGIPPPPRLPPSANSMPPAPPPMMSGGGPPPPPGAPPSVKLDVPTAPGRDDLLASIRAGNKSKLKKTQTVDKSAPALPGQASSSAAGAGAGAGAGGGDMASQLAAMLGARNKKVAAHNSDDEDDEDW